MSWKSQIDKQLLEAVEVVKEWSQEAPYKLEVYYSKEMGKTAAAQSRQFEGKRAILSKNTTKKLRVVSGDLIRSLQVGGDGNITNVKYDSKVVSIESGTNVVYAAIHEYGGSTGRNSATQISKRPFLNPAQAKFTKIEVAKLFKEINKVLK